MDISLVIPAYNEEKYVGLCIEKAQKHAHGFFKEVIVVDNASTDRTSEVALRYPGVRVVREEHKGLTYARQAGFEAATTEFIAYVDADCYISESWRSAAEKLVAKYPHAISWSGPAYVYDGRTWVKVLEWLTWWSAPIAYRLVGYMVLGGNFIIRRSAIKAIGGFDKSVEFYGEDMTLARRLAKEGRTIFSMNFYIYRSARRFAIEGFFTIYTRYLLNFFTSVFAGRPYDQAYTDVR